VTEAGDGMKRTPLRAKKRYGNSTLKPSGTPLPRTPAKQRAKIRGRAPGNKRLRDEWIACEARVVDICTGRAVDMHEVLPRSAGGDPTGETNILNVCRPCHSWITDYPNLAASLGLHEFRWPELRD